MNNQIEFEYNFIPLSSSKRDEDSNSDFDKYESYLIKQNEAKYLQNRINCEETMKHIDTLFGPFVKDEVEYYRENLKRDGETFIHVFQKELVFYMFYKYFGNTVSIKDINDEQYVHMVIASKKILNNNYMIILPEIISGKVNKYVSRKSVNKSIQQKIESSSYYPMIIEKYRNPSIIKKIISIIASIIASEFLFIDYDNKELTGQPVPINQDIIIEEVLVFTLLV